MMLQPVSGKCFPILLRASLLALSLHAVPAAAGGLSVIDDARQPVSLQSPARRIVSLAPHATELLFAAGAGSYIVGTSDYSDFPPAAKRIPSVGSAAALDLERIILLKPDLVVAWGSGNSAAQISRLKTMGIPVFESEPRDFAAIASNIERLSRLAGTQATGEKAAKDFRTRLQTLSRTYARRDPVTVFYQIWREPLMTLNDQHMVASVLRLCGGWNIFGQLPQLAPVVGVEAVVQANPEVIIADNGKQNAAFAGWHRFPGMTAVARGNLFPVNPDVMTRPATRILEAAEVLCKQLEEARAKRP